MAEDDPHVRILIESILNQSGYGVIPAEDGQRAVELFEANRDTISLVIMDIVMPNKNGMEAFREIQLICPDVTVLFCSGYTADFIQNRGGLNQNADLIMKPIIPLELLRKVRDMLDRQA